MDSCVVIAELRPIIGSCQFFIKVNRCVGDSNVVIASNKILIKGSNNSNIVTINTEDIYIASDSLSGLRVTDFSIQFRVILEPKRIYGSFKSEMLFKKHNSLIFNSATDDYRPNFMANEDVFIFCRQCLNTFNKTPFRFKRILPLPTNFDTSEFFCHNNICNDIKLKPDDCFYGLFSIQINVCTPVDCSHEVITCSHCEAWLGVKERNCISFWNSSVQFKDLMLEKANSGLYDFISVIKHVIRKDIAVGKIILYASFTNTEKNHLLIWVIEKNLSLLTNRNTNPTDVLLKEQKVFKVLYLHETEESSLLKTWEHDMNTLRLQISKQMMTEGLTHLKRMSQNIPEDYREVNNMFVSYVMV